MLPWVCALPFYWPLGALAAWRAIAEIFYAPFHWHKTDHGPTRGGRALRPAVAGGVEHQSGLECAADVGTDRVVSRGAVPALDRIDDRRVLRQRPLATARGGKRGRGQQRHGPVHHLKLLDEIAVMAREMDLAVEALVGPGEERRAGR